MVPTMKPNEPARSRKHVRSATLAKLTTLYSASATLAQDMSVPPPVTVAKSVVRLVTEQDDLIGRFQAVEEVFGERASVDTSTRSSSWTARSSKAGIHCS